MKIRNVPTTVALAALLSACMEPPTSTSAAPADTAPPAVSAQAASAPAPSADDVEVLAALVALYPPHARADVILAKLESGQSKVQPPFGADLFLDAASRDLGFGAMAHTRGTHGVSVSCVTSVRSYEQGIFEMRSTCTSRQWDQITPRLPAATLAHLAGNELVLSFDEPNVLAALRAGVARILGPTVPVTVPPDLSEAYRLLSADFGIVTVGDHCGIAGSQTSGAAAINLLEGSGRLDLIRNVTRSLNPGGRVFGARVLKRLGDPEDEDLVRQIRDSTAEMDTCGGCFLTRATAAKLL